MADATKDLIIRLALENEKLKQQMDDVDKTTKKTQSTFSKFKGVAVLASTVITGAIAVGLKKLISLGSEFEETNSKFKTTFRTVSKEAEAMSKTLQQSFGLAEIDAKKLLANTGDLLSGFGFTGKSALDLSGNINKLAVDLASFTNATGGAEAVSNALTKALLGERESLKTYGIAIMEVDIQQRLLEKGQKGLTGTALRQAKAQATLELAMEQSGNAIGDYARTQDSFANKSRRLGAIMKDLAVSAGTKLMKAIAPVVSVFVDWLEPTKDLTVLASDLSKTQAEYIKVVKRLKEEQNELTKSEKESLLTRKALLETDMIGTINEMNKALKENEEANFKNVLANQRNDALLDSINAKVRESVASTDVLTDRKIKLTGAEKELIGGGKAWIQAITNTQTGETKLADITDKLTQLDVERANRLKETSDRQDIVTQGLKDLALMQAKGTLTGEMLARIKKEYIPIILKEAETIEAEVEAQERANKAKADRLAKIQAEKDKEAELLKIKKDLLKLAEKEKPTAQQTIDAINKVINARIVQGDELQKLVDLKKKLEKQMADDSRNATLEMVQTYTQAFAGLLTTVTNTIAEARQAGVDARAEQLQQDSVIQAEIDAINESRMIKSDTEAQAEIDKLRAKGNEKLALEKEEDQRLIQLQRDKAKEDLRIEFQTAKDTARIKRRSAIAERATGFAVAVIDAIATGIKAFKSQAGIPIIGPILGAVAQGITLATTLASANKMKNKAIPAFATGGVISSPQSSPLTPTGEDGLIGVRRGEAILNQQVTAELGVDAINALNQGQRVGNTNNFYVQDARNALDVFNEFSETQGSSLRGAGI